VSPDQFDQMQGARLRHVVPKSSVSKFPEAIRPGLLTLTGFVGLVRWSRPVPVCP